MPKKFKFRLETILKVRRITADEKKRRVASRLRQIDACQRRASAAREHISEQFGRAHLSQQQPRLDVSLMSRQRYWIAHLQRELLESQHHIVELERRLSDERAELVEASTRVRILDKLREQQQRQHNEALGRTEQQEADELAVQSWMRFHA